ncbi:penicillin-binding protein 1A [Halofilum ochraceum]|uniref:penicillin-binding protein 1A n=1 Tax=Halofilum ochraceum TaxID=1611323 RepID=UPI0008DAD284|nr:penicillin-binding protein 1A [Halofilum ochraceum]
MTARSRFFLRLAKWLTAMAFAGFTAGALLLGGLYLYLSPRLPDIDQLRDVQLQEPLRVYTRDAELLAVYGTQRRIPLEIEAIPEPVRNAFIAAEDDRFYEHPGVDWMGIVRAAWNLVLTGEKTQGGSTITMQVARNFFLSRERTYLRKINEIFLALKIEREISKDEVLELYLNKIYLGKRAYGVAAAAQVYYGKDVDELTVAEMAMIAGLPKAPSTFNPIANPERARQRRDYVLGRMRANDMLDEAEYERALRTSVTATTHSAPLAVDAPYVGEMARLEAVQRFGEDVYTGGYRVYTSVDASRQRAAQDALHTALLDYERRRGYTGPIGTLENDRLPGPEELQARLGAAARGALGDVAEGLPIDDGRMGPVELDRELADRGAAGPLEPAVVLAVSGEDATVYRREGGLGRIPWDGLKWAAPRRENGGTGSSPEKPADVLAVGDIVRVMERDGTLRLAEKPDVQGALVALDPQDGGIRALVGGFSFEGSKFNRVTQSRRQPGSAFKPFIYSAALNDGFTPATLVNDAPVVFDDPALEDTWRPENYSGRVFGPTRLREGLVYSRNLVSIRVLLSIGIPYAIDYVQRFGFPEEQLPRDLTLALGSAALSPLQVATGYAVFANMGFRIEPYLVTRMATSDGEVVYRANPARACLEPCEAREEAEERAERETEAAGEPEGKSLDEQDRPTELDAVGVPDRNVEPGPRFAERVIPVQNAYMVRSFLRDVARRGTARGTRVLGRDDIAGKTGTTDDQLDAWFSGFNSSLVATGWVGYDEMKSLGARETGARAALPMWIDFMRTALKGTPETWPELPSDMVTVRIDPETGEYAGAGSQGAVFEIFRSDNAPEPPPEGTTSNGTGSGDGGNGEDPLF